MGNSRWERTLGLLTGFVGYFRRIIFEPDSLSYDLRAVWLRYEQRLGLIYKILFGERDTPLKSAFNGVR